MLMISPSNLANSISSFLFANFSMSNFTPTLNPPPPHLISQYLHFQYFMNLSTYTHLLWQHFMHQVTSVAPVVCTVNEFMLCPFGEEVQDIMTACSLILTLPLKACMVLTWLASVYSSLSNSTTLSTHVCLSTGSLVSVIGQIKTQECGL
jgi:hypothetical protein